MTVVRHAVSLCLALLIAFVPMGEALTQDGGAPIVLAQAQEKRPGLFRFLFRKRRGEQSQPQQAAPQRRQAKPQRQRTRVLKAKPQRQRASTRARSRKAQTRRQQSRRPAKERKPARAAAPAVVQQQEEETGPPEKSATARRLLVVGDFWGKSLAEGLEEAFAEDPDVVVVDAANSASGLVREDQYNWNVELPKLVEQHKPDILLVMIGANDRQPIPTPLGPAAERTSAWRAAYGGRVAALADTLRATGKPVLWTGLVPVRSDAMARDYSTFNSIFRERLEGSGITFVEVWDGFADAEGGFVASGPDVNGQTQLLRASDGVKFTNVGARKLAFFAERDIDRTLSQGAGAQIAALTDGLEDIGESGVQPSVSAMLPLEAALAGRGRGLSAYSETTGTVVEDILAQRLGGEPEAAATPAAAPVAGGAAAPAAASPGPAAAPAAVPLGLQR